MERWRERVALVTGASAGIGAAIAYQLQDAGMIVVAVARREEKIRGAVEAARREAQERGRVSLGRAATPGELHTLKCDCSKPQDVIDVFRWVKHELGGVDVLINNAGVIGDHQLCEAPTEEWRRILDLNVLGLSVCTREAIQQMKSRGIGDGHIIHMSSICSYIMPNVYPSAMYNASKHAVRVLTQGLRKELVAAKSRIRVTQICPGNVRTDIWTDIESMPDGEWYNKNPYLESEDVADATLYALSVPPHVQIHDIIIKPIGETF